MSHRRKTAEVLEQKRQEEDDWKRQLKEPIGFTFGKKHKLCFAFSELLGMSFSISWEISVPCGFEKKDLELFVSI